MTVQRVDPHHPEPAIIDQAAALIRRGGVVAFPTETVYGLGANALDPEAIARIYAAKGRPSHNPLIVHCADLEAAKKLAAWWPPEAEALARRFWPGPLTLVVRKRDLVPDAVTAGLPSVGLRVPRHPVAIALLRAASVPIAAPSANRYTELSPTTGAHVARGLGERVDALLDAGPTSLGIESTVIDLTGDQPVLLRPGSISALELEEVLGRRPLAPGEYSAEAPRPAPGMTPRHYAPRASLLLFHDTADWPGTIVPDFPDAPKGRVAALLRTLPDVDGVERVVRMPREASGYGSVLYAILHQLDEEGYNFVLVEMPPAGSEWAAVTDRLVRAATK